MKDFEYHRPKSLLEVWQLKAKNPNARYIAGGTDLMVKIREQSQSCSSLISLRNISELFGIEIGLQTNIGALTPIAALIEHKGLSETYPVLIQAARRLGSAQIRNTASIGGNICNASPCADMAPPLLVLDAKVRIEGSKGKKEISLDDFFVSPGETQLKSDEILSSIVIDKPLPGTKALFLKKGRVRMDLSVVNVAVLLHTEDNRCLKARIAAGSVAPRPLRLKKVELLLEGKELSLDLFDKAKDLASQEVSPISDLRSTEDYRRHLTGVYVKRALCEISGLSNDQDRRPS